MWLRLLPVQETVLGDQLLPEIVGTALMRLYEFICMFIMRL
jgi:hypothetical protein